MDNARIVLAGATGNLGGRIAGVLLTKGVHVRAIVRRNSDPAKIAILRDKGVEIAEVDFSNASQLTAACRGGACMVSAVSGLREVIVEVQTQLLHAAVNAGVPRFIPSDYAIDFTKIPPGANRNLDLRQEFRERLDKAPIAATSILNGMFADLLAGQAPVILFGLKRVVYWENADQPLDFTTMEDAAEFTAAAVLDDTTPRFLRIAGDQISARRLADVVSGVTGTRFRLLRAGGLNRLAMMIRITRTLDPRKKALYPPWQGMQYMHNMFGGRVKLQPIDNDRYPDLQWTTVKDFLAARWSRRAATSG